MKGWNIADAAAAVGGRLIGDGSAEITNAVIDSRTVSEGSMFVAVKGERTDGHEYISAAFDSGASCALAERLPEGETRPVILVPDSAQALRDLAKAYRKTLSLPIVGITGSVGKTTAKEMTASVLSCRFSTLRTEKNLNNELGVPLTLLNINPSHEAAVVELGISHFGDMRLLASMVVPDIAVYTVIGRAHLEFLGDRAGVMREKGELLNYMKPGGPVIVNGDDGYLRALSCGRRKLCYGRGPDNDIRAENIRGPSFDIVFGDRRIGCEVRAFGRHMISAALAAAAVGMELGLTDEEISAGIRAYEPVGRRARVIETPCLTIIDDCYNSNPDSAAMAIESSADLGGRLVCILGDMLELGENAGELHAEIGSLARSRSALLLTVGELSKYMGGENFSSKRELIAALPRLLREGDRVLVKASHSRAFEEITEALKNLRLNQKDGGCTN